MNSKFYDSEEVKEIIDEVLDKLFIKDKFLLENNVHEVSISHKLACYLDSKFDGWDVDCEYNRELNLIKSCPRVSNTNNIRPDIIVHKRCTENNFLIIEIKKDASEEDIISDIKKLKCMIKYYNYNYGLFINFNTKNYEYGCIWSFDKEFKCIN